MEDLDAYQLKQNPFEIVSHTHEMANRKEEWGHVSKSLSSAFKAGSPRFIFLLGDWGEGKSYVLDRIHRSLAGQIHKEGGVFVARLRSRVLYPRPLVLRESEPRWQKFGVDLIIRVLNNVDRNKWSEVLRKANLDGLDSVYRRLFQGLSDGEEDAFKYIAGRKLSAAELKNLEVSEPLSSSPQVLELFFDFLRAIKLAGYDNFLLLLDEFEYITAVLGDVRITQVLNTFREIFDHCGYYKPGQIANPVFFFAISPGGWERLKDLERSARKRTGGGGIAPFMERVSLRDIIQLKPFAFEDTKQLVKLRLEEFRTKKVADPFYPFTEKCIEYVHGLSFNKPRNVIQYCGILLEDALDESLKRIDATDAKRILKKYGIYPTESAKAEKSS